MADFIVLRLKPASPVDEATFTQYLTGLTIKVYDVSFANAKAGTLGDPTLEIGTATFNAPTFVGLPAPPPVVNYPANTTIAQHFIETLGAFGLVTNVDMKSVATALIPYAAPPAEYPSGIPRPDLRLHFERAGSKTIIDPDVYYDVALYTAGAAPSPDQYQVLPDSDVSAYVTLPAALDPTLASVDFSADGTIPNYDDLLSAINTVLAADPGGGQTLATLIPPQPPPPAPVEAPLTVEQCRNIAYEIVWGVEPPLPAPPEDIESMYTNPPNDGGPTNSNEQSRQQFEGNLNSYYATRNAKVERLAKYVYAVAGAVWCERQTAALTNAVITFPVNPAATTLATVKEAEVVLTGAIGVAIPAGPFYALGALLPMQVTPAQRLKMAIGADQQQNLTQLTNAYEAGVIAVPPTPPQPQINPAQAVRLLSSLSVPSGSAVECPVTAAATVWADFQAYPVTAPPPDNWRTYKPGDDETDFWPTEEAKIVPAGIQPELLKLDVYALTQGYVIANSAPPVSLADYILQHLVVHFPAGALRFSPVTKIPELADALESDWEELFLVSPPPAGSSRIDLLPPFTLPGTPDARIAAFVRYVRKFFDLPTPKPTITNAPVGAPPSLPLPAGVDAIQNFVAAYQLLIGGPFVFGTVTPLPDPTVDQAVANVFPGDSAAQRWLKDTVKALNDICALANVPGSVGTLKPSPEFSIAEALYARGFTSVADVLALTQADFEDALRGTLAYDQAAIIYAKALTLGSATSPPAGAGGTFHPVNPGSLTNCIPPCYLSPLGAVEYLHELLQLSEQSTCDDPFAAPASGHGSLGDALTSRRGPLGSLHVTSANEAIPLPLIDLVNECLESMSSSTPPGKQGVVYDTAGDTLAGHKLCEDDGCCHDRGNDHDGRKSHQGTECHDPSVLFAAMPEHSTPASPTSANAEVEPAAFNQLKADFSSCCLPYSQALDVARCYLRHFCTSRFEVMRSFRRCITEFVLDPQHRPSGFQDHLWRYPVRIDIAIEYLCITPEEYVQVFGGTWPDSCSGEPSPLPGGDRGRPSGWELYGSGSEPSARLESVVRTGIGLPEFLERTCLTYCEFVELWKSNFVPFRNGADREAGLFPDCEPCCLADLSIVFPEEPGVEQSLYELIVFIRLWRKLRNVCDKGYSFSELADICTVLKLFAGASVNPDFVRQLAAFQMLRDFLELKLTDHREKPAPGATGADRLHILALWVGPSAQKWEWALRQFLDRVRHHAQHRYQCPPRPELIKLLHDNLDPLSVLAGFDPATSADTWNALPTHTLRFAEVLTKLTASKFSVGEILYLFTTDPHLDGDDPYPLQEINEALDSPLNLPEDDAQFSLWKLRHKLLEVRIEDDEASEWSWPRIVDAFELFGFLRADVITLGEHFFPDVLTASGHLVPQSNRRYSTALAAAATNPLMWNFPPRGPFRYESSGEMLWTELPLEDGEVVEQLAHLSPLNPTEQQAVQDLYFAPRRMLAMFAAVFDDFTEAEGHLILRREHERWTWFQHQFARWHRRCHIIAEHLGKHVAAATGQEDPDGAHVALLLLLHLFADENVATSSWENDNGHAPGVTWTPPPRGGAFAALLGLTGTGLLAEYTTAGGALAWRDVSGAMSVFEPERSARNCPVTTIVPSPHATVPLDEQQFITVLNGLAMRNADGALLGGAEGFTVTWTGALLIDEAGTYEFCAGGPTPDGEKPHEEDCEHQQWRVLLKRGQRTWLLLEHQWHEDDAEPVSKLALKRGAYEVTIRFTQRVRPIQRDEDACPLKTGFQLKYVGPDTGDRLIALPHHRLFRVSKNATLADGILGLTGIPLSFLKEYYTSSLRDIRRTYQRAFKAVLFAHRFGLSAERWADRRSELGYMLSQKSLFAGHAFYRSGAGFVPHDADFDFNLLPVLDYYLAPSSSTDLRVQPTAQRRQALFDEWERTFDYVMVRQDVERDCDRRLWLLFDEAEEKQPSEPGYLLRHMCADARHWALDLHYFQDQGAPVYPVGFDDLEDDRWVVRAWHADEWLQRLRRHACAKDIRSARPDLWASDDPSAIVPGTGPDGQPNPTGNANLSQFLVDGCAENNAPRRYEDLRRLNDCLRERGRDALLAYLCSLNRVPLPWGGFAQSPNDLSALLLIDVEAGVCERASRVEEAITAVQNFVRRARLGLEPGWTVTQAFALLWDRRFATYKLWESCQCRELYKENWIDWTAHEAAQKVESYRFLQSELRRSTLTVALPGGLEYWPDQRPAGHPGLRLLQDRDPSSITQLNPVREGLAVLGTPEHDARPSWLAPLGEPNGSGVVGEAGAHAAVPPVTENGLVPFWIESAIRLGVRFFRIAAGGVPPASAHFEPRTYHVKPGCCTECERSHPQQVDEYYFWLLDARFFKAVDQTDSPSFVDFEQDDYYDPNMQDATPWHDPAQLPTLLEWKSSSIVRLAWCRVHNGEFKQPRRSYGGVQVAAGASPDLTFVGREADSLVFAVAGGVVPTGFSGTDAPGFRYDLATDSAIVLPFVVDPPGVASPYPAGLPAYPYFVYVAPGAPLFTTSLYSPALAVACALRTRCRFEAALKWYALVFEPLRRDDTWMVCDTATRQPRGDNGDATTSTVGVTTVAYSETHTINGDGGSSACCDTTDVSDVVAAERSVLLHYVDTLLEWGDALMRRHSPEAFEQARLIVDTAGKVLGPRPKSINAPPPAVVQTVSAFKPLFAPINPRLLDLYSRVDDRLALIRNCLNARRLGDGRARQDLPYWGWVACCGCNTLAASCDHECRCSGDGDWCKLQSPYRFLFLLQKAQELAGLVREFGGGLLAAFEKGDAEYLASLRAGHELELLNLARTIRQDQWREADWQRQGLQKSKEVAQTNRRYYATLIQNGLNSGELQYENQIGVSLSGHVAADVIEGVAEAMALIPDLFVGFPCEETWLPLGTKLSGMFQTIARITNSVADMATQTASLDLTQASWARRLEEWVHQVEVLDIDIQQIERQILAAERRRNVALQELNNHQRQSEQAKEVQDFLRDKFTNHGLYLFLQKETAALHYKIFELARHAAEQAERAFNFERGDTAYRFLPCEPWDNLREGLLAGERLQLALRTMEKAYLDLNAREYELTKHFSLRLHFPIQFLRLKTTGVCEVEVPEWMFDLDHPGQFMRRIKNVTMTFPCVTGPYTGVHCRLTLLSSNIRVSPSLERPPGACCGKCNCENDYEPCRCDPRFVKYFGARDAIATSTGQNDDGMFELNFRDERYLPFEFFGAISRWRIELPRENNFFDMETLSDVILNLNYTAREGGDLLRQAANRVAQCRVQHGWSLFDVRNEFPDAWHLFQPGTRRDDAADRPLTLSFTRRLFPFLPCDRKLMILRFGIMVETTEAREYSCCRLEYSCCGNPREDARPCRGGCEPHLRHCDAYSCVDCQAKCCCECIPNCHVVELTPHTHHHADPGKCECDEIDVRCVASDSWPGLYYGVVDAAVGPLHEDHRCEVTLEVPPAVGEVRRVYILCYYEVVPAVCDPPARRHHPHFKVAQLPSGADYVSADRSHG